MKRKIVARKNLPLNLPTTPTVIIYLALDGLQLGPFWWGVATIFVLVLWGLIIYGNLKMTEEIDLFKAAAE